jgi:anthraniloyl-CoA monooxygenase
MRIACIGGGPAGLYLAILMKKADPDHDVTVLERNRHDDTFGFGVVFSDATLGGFAAADAESHDAIRARFAHWDDVDIHYGGEIVTSHGHGFAGMGRRALLEILERRARDLGVKLMFERDLGEPDVDRLRQSYDVVVGADGVNSLVRRRFAAELGPRVDLRPNRFVWLGTTFPFRAFTFYFKKWEAGLFRVHAYRYAPEQSTFIVECTEDTFRRTGLDELDEDATLAYCERVFADELQGHRLLKNRSHWRQFPTVRLDRWHHENVVLAGDAVHTAHFSIGSGTKLAMEGAIALANALVDKPDVPAALAAYEAAHRPVAEKLQRAAQVSLQWFEETERYVGRLPVPQFAFSLMTRSLRISHENLRQRDPRLIARVDRWFAADAAERAGLPAPAEPTPPMFTPCKLRGLVLRNRVVAAPALRPPVDALAPEWRALQLGSHALGGAALVLAALGDGEPAREREPWRRVVELVHRASGARLGAELAGRDRDELVVQARACVEAGFDLVLLRDPDPESLAAVRAALPETLPLAARLEAGDADGDAHLVPRARALAAAGCDLVCISAGTLRGRLAQAPVCERVRLDADVATMLCGNVASISDVNSVLAAGRADLCLIGPQRHFDPSWTRRAADEQRYILP